MMDQKWDAFAGARLVEAVRGAAGAIPPALEPHTRILELMGKNGDLSTNTAVSDQIVPAVPDAELDSFSRSIEALRNLAEAVGEALSSPDLYDEFTKSSRWKERANALGEVRGQLERAIVRLQDPVLLGEVSAHFKSSLDGVPDILGFLGQLLSAVRSASETLPEKAPLDRDGETGQSVLIKGLLRVFEEGFGTAARDTLSLTWEAHHGPFVSFLRKAYEIEGREQPSDNALKKSLQRYLLKSPPGGE